MGGQGTSVSPIETATPIAAPDVTAGDNSEILQEIRQDVRQIQNTVTTTNHSLDAARAKLESQRLRKQERQSLMVHAILVGLAIVFLAAPSPVGSAKQAIGYMIGIGIIVGALAIPFVVPW